MIWFVFRVYQVGNFFFFTDVHSYIKFFWDRERERKRGPTVADGINVV